MYPVHYELTYIVQIGLIIAFFALLVLSIVLLKNFYICDKHNTVPFIEAAKKGKVGSKEHTLFIIESLCNDGMWPLPYISAAILTPIALFIMQMPITVYYFTILFLISFLSFYAILLFFTHHYIQFIKNIVIDYINK